MEEFLKIKLHQTGSTEASFQEAKQLLKVAINVVAGNQVLIILPSFLYSAAKRLSWLYYLQKLDKPAVPMVHFSQHWDKYIQGVWND